MNYTWYVVFSLELQVYVECSGIFPRLRTRRNKPIEKWTKRNLPHTLVYSISNSPTCWYINMNAGYTLKAKRVCVPNNVLLCIVKNFLQKGPKEVDCAQLLYHSSDCLHTRANSAQGEGTRRLKRVDVSRSPILLPLHLKIHCVTFLISRITFRCISLE